MLLLFKSTAETNDQLHAVYSLSLWYLGSQSAAIRTKPKEAKLSESFVTVGMGSVITIPQFECHFNFLTLTTTRHHPVPQSCKKKKSSAYVIKRREQIPCLIYCKSLAALEYKKDIWTQREGWVRIWLGNFWVFTLESESATSAISAEC